MRGPGSGGRAPQSQRSRTEKKSRSVAGIDLHRPKNVSAHRSTRAPAPRRSTFKVRLYLCSYALKLCRAPGTSAEDTPRGWRCPACCEVQARVSTGRTDFVRRTYSGIPTSLRQIAPARPRFFLWRCTFTPRFTWILGEISFRPRLQIQPLAPRTVRPELSRRLRPAVAG